MQSSNRYMHVGAVILALISAAALSACQQSGNTSTGSAASASARTAAVTEHVGKIALTAYTPNSYKPLSTCNLGMVNSATFGSSTVALNRGAANTFKGWVVANSLSRPTYWLRFDDPKTNTYRHIRFQLTIERPDVVATHPGASLQSGFAVTLPANSISSGQFHVYLAVRARGTTYICDSGRHIKVTR